MISSLLLSVALAGPVPGSTPSGIGVGIILGLPTGISGVYRLSEHNSFNAAIAWSIPNDELHFHVDYIYTVASFKDSYNPNILLPVYFGVGPRLKIGRDDILGIRVPLGVGVQATEIPLDFFAEIVPVVGLIPETKMGIDAAVGLRFMFGSLERAY